MSKKEKLIARLLTYPKDFEYDEIRTLPGYFGFEERSKGRTSGSRVEYARGNDTILLPKPHPDNRLRPYQIRQIVNELKTLNLL